MDVAVVLGLLSLLSSVATSELASSASNITVLSRQKRYLVFPEGSVFSFAFCMEIKTLTADYDIFTSAIAVAANYDLPTKQEDLFASRDRLPVQVLQRRYRRDIYSRVENILNLAGLDGRSCVLRSVCEASQWLSPGVGMLEEIVRILFKIPVERMSREEPREHWQYSTAYRSGARDLDCQKLYPRCPVSLLSVVMDLKPADIFFK